MKKQSTDVRFYDILSKIMSICAWTKIGYRGEIIDEDEKDTVDLVADAKEEIASTMEQGNIFE